MVLSARFQLRQSQALAITPQLMQSIRLLQLTHAELELFIEEALEKNPLLERPETRPDDGPLPKAGDEAARIGLDHLFVGTESSATMSERLDTAMDNIFPDDPGVVEPIGPELAMQWKSASVSTGGSQTIASGTGKDFDVDMLAADGITLANHVGEQIAFAFRDRAEQAIANELADALDEAGYLRIELAELGQRLGCSEAEIMAVLARCQQFDPPGIFARNLRECLSLQLASRDRLDPAMQRMIDRLDLVARRDFAQLRLLCGVGDDDLLDMIDEIRQLDPHPGAIFTAGVAGAIVPDVNVRQGADGSWQVELNEAALPRVLVNHVYYAQVSKHASSKADRDFISSCMQDANWLTRSLDQRARTILKVASEIVRQQDAFLLHGVRSLRPLSLREVAEATGMHESTISRVTANKYMMTPRGVFELRHFFSVAIASVAGGESHSAAAVREQIRELIDKEEPHSVLSDDGIVNILRESGVEIARRTVAKYREAMDIPSSVQRRREKRARASASR